MGNDPNKKKTTTGSNYQVYDYFPVKSGTVLGGKASGSITSPMGLTGKIVGKLSKVFNFGKTTASERPGVKPATAVSNIKTIGIQPVGGKAPKLSLLKKESNIFNPAEHRANRYKNYSGWSPTSFSSLLGGFSGVKTYDTHKGVRDLTTGIIGSSRFGTFGRTGETNLSKISPGRNINASGWNKFAGFASINQGDTKGYSLSKIGGGVRYGNTHKNIFQHIIQSQQGKGYMGSNFLGETSSSSHTALSSSSKMLKDLASKKSLFIQNAYEPEFLHNTLSGISDAFKRDKPTYNINTSSGGKSVKTKSHPLSPDYELYKSYMNKFFPTGSSGKANLGGGDGLSEYSFKDMVKEYTIKTKSGKIPTISEYSTNLLGYDIFHDPRKPKK
jgi:hypothetical protein